MTICNQCTIEKEINEFPLLGKGRRRGICKDCRNKKRNDRYIKKKTGFEKLQLTKRMLIISELEGGDKIKDIADRHGLNYFTFQYWRRQGQLIIA